MKEILLQYSKYNIWANKQLLGVLQKLDDEQLDMEIESSFPSIRKTVYHMWSAEDIWLQRLNLVEHAIRVDDNYKGGFQEAADKWQKTSADLLAFINKQYDDRALEHVLQYYSLKKQSFKVPVYAVMVQLFNHASYHRGQLVTMLRQAGVKKIPQTDFHVFVMKK